MAFTVMDVMQHDSCKKFQLAAGVKGLNRQVEKVNILDYEYDFSGMQQRTEGLFQEYALVLSSLLFAKQHPERILGAVKQLVDDGASCLAIKSVYYSDLPADVMDYANRVGFPIFFFGSEDGFFEDIIVTITDAIKNQADMERMEQKVQILAEESINRLHVYTLLAELSPEIQTPYVCIYYLPKGKMSKNVVYHRITSIQNILPQANSVFPYRGGILLLISEDSLESVKDISAKYHLADSEYTCGCSRQHEELDDIGYGIQESLYAADYARRNKMIYARFAEMGIDQLLMPYQKDYWMNAFAKEFLSSVEDYDKEYDADLIATARQYFLHDGDVMRTAQALHLHKNTIRYRLGKIRELVNPKQNQAGFYELLFLAIQFLDRK